MTSPYTPPNEDYSSPLPNAGNLQNWNWLQTYGRQKIEKEHTPEHHADIGQFNFCIIGKMFQDGNKYRMISIA